MRRSALHRNYGDIVMTPDSCAVVLVLVIVLVIEIRRQSITLFCFEMNVKWA